MGSHLFLAEGWFTGVLLTTAMVYAVHRLLRARGGELAGLAASAPIISAPALLWLAQARGPAAAAEASLAGLRLTGVIAVVVVGLLSLAPRGRRAVDAGCRALPGSPIRADVLSAAFAGVVTGACLAAGSVLSAAACGILASLPWTGICAFACILRLHGRAGAVGFLRGYAQGLPARLVFFGGVGLSVPAFGGPLAVLVGLLAAGLALGLQRRAVPSPGGGPTAVGRSRT